MPEQTGIVRLDRRLMLGTSLGVAAGALIGSVKPTLDELVYIGMHGSKIHAARFNPHSGELTALGPVADNLRPTWSVMNPSFPVVYFNEESGNDGKGQGGVQAWRIDRHSGALTKVSDLRAGGGGTTNLWFDRRSSTLLAVNYGGGQIVSFPVNGDGTIGPIASQVQVKGSGPHRRQANAHPHGVAIDPTGRWVVVSDLGADRIWVFPFDRKTRQIGDDDSVNSRHVVLPPGTGPRHIAFHPTGRWLYLVEELTANVSTFSWDSKNGRLIKVQTLSTDDQTYTGEKSAAEVAVSRDGRFVYISNRGENAMVVHAVDQRTGSLRQIQSISVGGALPWHFAIHRSGKWLLSANRDANQLALFSIDQRTGLLTDSGKRLESPKPVHVDFTGF